MNTRSTEVLVHSKETGRRQQGDSKETARRQQGDSKETAGVIGEKVGK
jgi:hypothetical protein